jgi:sulfite reductase (NADPH) flavoprotein alpha-component
LKIQWPLFEGSFMPVPVLPPSAPFTPEQRAFLNGFFAGVFGVDTGASLNRVGADSSDTTIPAPPFLPAALNGAAPIGVEPEVSDEAPWHDPNLSLDERMQLAEGKPKPLLLMAAMAQLDCGQCGYVCKTYAAALANGNEKSFKKCIPGGKETSTKLKELIAA